MSFRQKTKVDIDEKLFSELGLSVEMLQILALRGLKSKEEILCYLHPSLDDMRNPFELSGMKEATARINNALEKKEQILIYGDYDCDGICAVAILVLFFKSKGVEVDYFIPIRNADGYGLSKGVIERIVSKKKTDLIITVDCGITSVEEIAYLSEQGIDVVVTDHHEPPKVLPNCIVVDPKVEKKGFYEYCGAGVALKLVEALSSREEIKEYLDIAAIATIADIVPLVGENRVIASVGLEILNQKIRKGIFMLRDCSGAVTAHEIMYRLAPKINSAGRMDEAKCVVELFTTDEYFVLKELTEKLNHHNTMRQQLCEDTLQDVLERLKGFDFSTTMFITLYDKNWDSGILGIVASRVAEQFHRPVALFSECGGILKGSARSIRAVNVYEVLSTCSEWYFNFGGHEQAAGLSFNSRDFENFKSICNDFVLSKYADEIFCRVVAYDLPLDIDVDLIPFAKELLRLEPTGFGNSKPVFKIATEGLRFETIGASEHIKYVVNSTELVGFSKKDMMSAAKSKGSFEVLLSLGEFNNREFAQLILRSVFVEDVTNLSNEYLKTLQIPYLSVENLTLEETKETAIIEKAERIDKANKTAESKKIEKTEEIDKANKTANTEKTEITEETDKAEKTENITHSYVVENSTPNRTANTEKTEEIESITLSCAIEKSKECFGTLVVCFSHEALQFAKSVFDLDVEIYASNHLNPKSKIVLCPALDFEFAYYNRVILIDSTPNRAFVKKIAQETKVYFCQTQKEFSAQTFEKISDERLREIYIQLKNAAKQIENETRVDLFLQKNGVSNYQLVLAKQIFEELNLIIRQGSSIIINNEKTALEKAATYRNMQQLGE